MSDTNRAADSKSQRRGLESDGANPSELSGPRPVRQLRRGKNGMGAHHDRVRDAINEISVEVGRISAMIHPAIARIDTGGSDE